MSKTISDLEQIVSVGGGIIIDAKGRITKDLIKIASFAAESRATVVIKNASPKTTNELMQIGAAGRGTVMFEL